MTTQHWRSRWRGRAAAMPGASSGATAASPPVTRWARAFAALSLPLMAWALTGIGLPAFELPAFDLPVLGLSVAGTSAEGTAYMALPRLGAFLMASGGLWALWAAWKLADAGASVWPGDAPQVLVDDGPFRLGRHPMALGMATALCGAALAAGSPLALLLAVAWVAVQHRWLLAEEEAELRRSFGGWYRDYEAHTRRWL